MRAFFPSVCVLVSSFLLMPLAYGHSLQPGPAGSPPSDNSVILTFASSEARTSYLVDRKGYYEFDAVQANTQIGPSLADDGPGAKGPSSPASLSLDALHSKSSGNGGTGLFSGGSGSSFLSSGGGNSGSGGPSMGPGMFESQGRGLGSGLGDGNKGLGMFAILSNSDASGLGSQGLRDAGPSVNATPLPGSWTMMLIGLCSFGYLAHRLRKTGNASAAA